jgi:hypothetical protein
MFWTGIEYLSLSVFIRLSVTFYWRQFRGQFFIDIQVWLPYSPLHKKQGSYQFQYQASPALLPAEVFLQKGEKPHDAQGTEWMPEDRVRGCVRDDPTR